MNPVKGEDLLGGRFVLRQHQPVSARARVFPAEQLEVAARDLRARGEVVDFLDFYWGSWHFAAFNVADMAITTGAGLMILDMLLEARRNRRAAASPGGP